MAVPWTRKIGSVSAGPGTSTCIISLNLHRKPACQRGAIIYTLLQMRQLRLCPKLHAIRRRTSSLKTMYFLLPLIQGWEWFLILPFNSSLSSEGAQYVLRYWSELALSIAFREGQGQGDVKVPWSGCLSHRGANFPTFSNPHAVKKVGAVIPHLLPSTSLSPNTCPSTSIIQLQVFAELNWETKDHENTVTPALKRMLGKYICGLLDPHNRV